jgi:hypothetical protein
MHLAKKVALVLVASGFLVGTLAGCGGEKKDRAVTVTPPKVETK